MEVSQAASVPNSRSAFRQHQIVCSPIWLSDLLQYLKQSNSGALIFECFVDETGVVVVHIPEDPWITITPISSMGIRGNPHKINAPIAPLG